MPAIPLIGAAIVGGASIAAANKSSKAANTAAASQERSNQEAIALEKERLAMEKEGLEIAKSQAKIGQETYDYYKTNFRPLEEQYLSEAKGLGSIANQNKGAQQAAADVAAGFAGAREALRKNPGLDPGSQVAVQEGSKINLAEAATSAAAQTAARETAKDKGRAATVDAISIGKGLPATAGAQISSGLSGYGAAAGGLQAAANFHARLGEGYGRQAQGYAADSGAAMGAAGRIVGGITASPDFKKWTEGWQWPTFGGINNVGTSLGTAGAM